MRKCRLNRATRPNGTCGSRDVASDGYIPSQRKRTHGLLAVQHDDEVRDVCANLETPSNTASRNA